MTMDAAARLLREAKHVVVFTGAGASAESGIPTFRDALTGLWARFDPSRLATQEAYRAEPDLCWGWYKWRRRKVAQAQPNHAHLAIVELAKHVPKVTVVTQNVDDLHERAGNQGVIHLHGSLHSPRCLDCGATYTSPLSSEALPEEGARIEPPRCSSCSGNVRPGVVWFGEMLPEQAWDWRRKSSNAYGFSSLNVAPGLGVRMTMPRDAARKVLSGPRTANLKWFLGTMIGPEVIR